MVIAAFGASGRTGRLVVDQAALRGEDVTAIVRSRPDPAIAGAARTALVDLGDRAAVARALEGADGVVWATGPIAGVTHTEVSDALRTAVDAMVDAGVRRIVATANGSVLTDDEVTGQYANVAAEHRRNVATLRRSDLDWTVLAAPYLSDDAPTGRVETVPDGKPAGRWLRRADFAATLLDALDRPEWVGHIVGVANR
jgi:putative NADH-flavin reductase